jgi:hypothetical protein
MAQASMVTRYGNIKTYFVYPTELEAILMEVPDQI